MAEEFSAISNLTERLGRRFYPSASAFPAGMLSNRRKIGGMLMQLRLCHENA
jgi:hypothetical protein